MNSKTAIFWGALLAAAAVGLGAYGAHGLHDRLIDLGFVGIDIPKRMDWFETGVKYHMYHALGMIVAGLIIERSGPSKILWLVPAFFLSGIFLFSGSLYAMTFLSADWSKLGAVVPIGGASFITGWICLAIGSRKNI